MKRLALFLFALLNTSLALASDQAAKVFSSAAPSVFSIGVIGEDGNARFGSGVMVERGKIATNYHVVSGAKGIYVKLGAQTFEGRLAASDEKHDLALIAVNGLNVPPAELSNAALQVGQSVYAIGSPRGLELSLSEGLVSSLRDSPEGRVIQTTAAISPGSSGGGLFNEQGQLVGLTTAQVLNGQNLKFAIPVEWLRHVGMDVESFTTVAPASTVATPAVAATAAASQATPAVQTANPAAAATSNSPPARKQKPSKWSMLFASCLMLGVVLLIKPAISWLTDLMSSDALPAPAISIVSVEPAAAEPADDRLAPFRAQASEEIKQNRADKNVWLQAVEQAGGDETRAADGYVALRAQALRRAEMDRKWQEAVAQNQGVMQRPKT